MSDSDAQASVAERIRSAAARGTPLAIRSGGTKEFLGCPCEGEILDVSGLRGIVHYEPTELVVSARAGTPLAEIEAALAERGQMLGFEPPHYGTEATLGGTIACGLSGPARPFRGAARDFVLGVKVINGAGESLKFGGEVMKNVAGYDVARLMCGAYGTLGVLLEISLKVLPLPAAERGLVQETTADDALDRMRAWQRRPLPLTGLSYDGRYLHIRLAGAETAVDAAHRLIGGDLEDGHSTFWSALREQRGVFFDRPGDLWRVSVPPRAAPLPLTGEQLIDWGGALRWIKTTEAPDKVFAAARALGGHAQRYCSDKDHSQAFQPLPDTLMSLHRRIKRAFDPQGILNRGRLYPEF